MIETEEQNFVQKFIPKLAIDTFDDSALHHCSRRDVVPSDTGCLSPAQGSVAGERVLAVADDRQSAASPHADEYFANGRW